MFTNEKEDVTGFVRTALCGGMPTPTGEVRRRSWRAFQAALERHLAKRRPLKPVQSRN
jgi:hypothetical protein